ncbi:glycosyltransferase family 2 protein [uncultured Mailhella sp.]|uniref:glycosyltransferase family A protein n=1 Tax=uncultured Mailhella sp. TaxID=1981031 RepID=UPI003209CFE4
MDIHTSLDSFPKVSIISPCYNGERYLNRFFDSLLIQNYKNVEFIFVDDGSTDNTKKIFDNYDISLKKKGWSVKYLYQKNQGQAAALNNALKLITGDYILWPDSDDILYKNHILHKVEYMEYYKNIGIAYCFIDYADEESIDNVYYTQTVKKNEDMFKNIINDKNVPWPPICTIIRTSSFLKINPTRTIPVARGGQNCQMQMPMLYKQPYGVISEVLAKYVVRKNSHSRTQYNNIKRHFDLAKIWIKCIDILPCNDLEKTILKIKVISRHIKQIITTQFKFNIRLSTLLEKIFSAKHEEGYKVIRIFTYKIFSKKL